MVKATLEDGSPVASFLMKCYEMVDDRDTDRIISWSESNASFVIWDMTTFSQQLLPNYFKHNNFSSFMRQLNIYGFRKSDTDRWEFSNENFIRGQKQLMKNIIRRKKLQNLNQRKSSQQKANSDGACETENFELWKEVESLKTDKNSLMQELVKLSHLQETSQDKMIVLRKRLQGMETDQQQMFSFLIMAMQSPEFLAQLLHPKENNWRTAEPANNMWEEVLEGNEVANKMLIEYHPSSEVASKDPSPPPQSPFTLNSQRSLDDEFFEGLKDLYINPDFMKFYMDEKLSPTENQGSFFQPDIPDDSVLQQLPSGHLLENIVDEDSDSEDPIESIEMESLFGATQMGKSLSDDDTKSTVENLSKLGSSSLTK